MSNDEAAEPRTVDDIVRDLLKFMTDRVEGAWPDTTYIGGGQWVKGCEACGAHTGYPADDDHNQGCPHVALILEARAFLEAERAGKPTMSAADGAASDLADPSALARAVKREKTGGALLHPDWPGGSLDAIDYLDSVDPAGLHVDLRARMAHWRAARDVADPSALARAVADATRPGVARWISNDGQTRLYLRRGVTADDMARMPWALRTRLENYLAADTAQKGR